MRARTWIGSIVAVLLSTVAACGDAPSAAPPTTALPEAGFDALGPGDASTDAPTAGDASSDGADGGLEERGISDGLGQKTGGGTGSCTPTEDRYIDGDYGIVKARDGRTFPVPGPVTSGATCTDLYNPCAGGANPDYESQLTTVVVDSSPQAVVVTGYVYGDNYFELYVNGKYVCRDALTFVPFNAHVVRFKATYPMTIALQGVDWEQHLGVGVETKNGATNVGDGGLVARFVDENGRVTVTDASWRCRPHYIAPVDDPSCVTADRDSTACPPATCVASGLAGCHGVHWPIPSNWTSPAFDDGKWPFATTYTAAQIGPKTAYTANASSFDGADFVWSKNLTIDDLVLCRRTVAP